MNGKKKAIAIVMIAGFAIGLASMASAGIVGSKHDFTPGGGSQGFQGEAWVPATGEYVLNPCTYCHTPHNSMTVADSMSGGVDMLQHQYLWNRKLSTYLTYSVYTSPTMTLVMDSTPKGITLMCMSCHDGVTTIDNIKNGPGGQAVAAVDTGSDQLSDLWNGNGDMLLGIPAGDFGPNIGDMKQSALGNPVNLSNDHPVSFTWVSGLKDINDPDVNGKWANGLKLFNNRMECSTCHSVHDPTIAPFLRVSNSGSTMCTTCHNK